MQFRHAAQPQPQPLPRTSLRSRLVVATAAMLVMAVGWPGLGLAEDPPSFSLTLKDHKFQPAQITVPANKRLVLMVTNNDNSVEEFESHDLKAEKIVAAGRTISVRVGPLKPGRYKFEGEFHAATAQGILVAE